MPALENADGTTIAMVAPGAPASVSGQPDGWQRFEFTLRATASEPKARLALTFTAPAQLAAEYELPLAQMAEALAFAAAHQDEIDAALAADAAREAAAHGAPTATPGC